MGTEYSGAGVCWCTIPGLCAGYIDTSFYIYKDSKYSYTCIQ